MKHSERCHLGTGYSWAECLCAEIDPSDRPCMSCEQLAESAKFCMACRNELLKREIRPYIEKVEPIKKEES